MAQAASAAVQLRIRAGRRHWASILEFSGSGMWQAATVNIVRYRARGWALTGTLSRAFHRCRRRAAPSRELGRPIEEGRCVGHLAVQDEVSHLFEAGAADELLDRVAAVEEAAAHAVDISDGGVARDQAFEASPIGLLGEDRAVADHESSLD